MVKTIYPRIRLVDRSPFKRSQLHLGEVKRGDHISVMLESTLATSEKGLFYSVSFVYVSASRACLRSIRRINILYRDASFESFVLNKELQFIESPTVEHTVQAFPMFGSTTNASQVFHNNNVTLLKTIDKFSAYLVQNRVNPYFFCSTQPLQMSFSRFCTSLLKRSPKSSKTLTFSKYSFTFNFEAVRSDQEIVHADIDANRVASFRFWDYLVDCDVEKESFISVNQDCMCWLSVLKKFSLVLTNIQRRFHSLLNRGDRCIDSIGFVDKSEKPFIQIHRKLSKLKKSTLSLFVGFGDSVSCSYGEVCRKVKLLSSISVSHVVKDNWIKNSCFKSYLGNVVACISKSFKSIHQPLRVFSGWFKFADGSFREFHKKTYMQFKYLGFPIPPVIKIMGFLGGIL